MRRIPGPAAPLRLVGELLARLSRDRLAAGGAPISADKLQAAVETGPEELERVALDYALRLGAPRFTLPVIAGLAGLTSEEVRRLWLALGFAQPTDDEVVFTDGDLIALSELRRVPHLGPDGLDDAVGLARLVGESFARISEALVRLLQVRVAQQLADEDAPDVGIAVALAAVAAGSELGTIDELLTYAWKRHLAAAIRRAALRGADETEEPPQCVGFVDIAGFTRLAARVDHSHLARVLDGFQAAAYRAAVVRGSRIVKTVGDEIMFVTDTPDVGLTVAMELAQGFEFLGECIDVHVGIAWGGVLARDGDFYGETVNIASRLCDAAPARGVLLDRPTRDALAAGEYGPMGTYAPTQAPGLGEIDAWLVMAPDGP